MAKSAIVIDGIEHEVPDLASFTFDEHQIMFDHSKLVTPDFSMDEDDPEALARVERHYWNPGFQRTLMIVAYMRANPGTTRAKAEELIGKVKPLEAFKYEEDEEGPPEVAPSSNSSDGADVRQGSPSEPSGSSSSAVSEARPAEIRELTGTSGLVTPPDRGLAA